nr:hypothetical protein [Tanacetum cinerariifolium]
MVSRAEVNTRTDAELAATVQNALQTLLPQIRADILEEFRTSSGPSGSGGNPPPIRADILEEFRTSSGPSGSGRNPPPVTIHTWLERFNKQKPRPMDAENWISHMEKIFDVIGCTTTTSPDFTYLPTSPTKPLFTGPSRKRCRSPPPVVPSPRGRSSLPPPYAPAEAIIPEFVIPEATTLRDVRSSPSLVILSNTEADVMVILVVLLEIALEAATTAIVASPTVVLDLAIESDPKVEPSQAPPSLDYIPSSPIHAPASPDYHPGLDTESEPFKDESKPIEDAPETAEPLPAASQHRSPYCLRPYYRSRPRIPPPSLLEGAPLPC